MKPGIKLLVVGMENSGKTTLISQLENALVVSTDNKAFRGKVAHFRQSHYDGLDELINTIGEKIEAYEAKYGSLPKTLVIDSVTHLATNMEKWANDKFTGFNIWSNLSKDTLAFNSFLEDDVIPAGINVVITAHTQYDADIAKYKIASPGSFGKNGSWLAVTDEAVFLETKGSKRLVHYKTSKFPCRTLQPDLPDSIDVDKFDINEHVSLLESSVEESQEWSI